MDLDEYEREGGSSTEDFSETDSLILKTLDSESQERLLLQKLDRRILPILCLLYLFAREFNGRFLRVNDFGKEK
jgi:hypothetical protein